MTHYTLTGYNAGHPLCGLPRDAESKYLHFDSMYGRPHPADLCPDCMDTINDIINNLDNDEDN